MIKRSPPVFNQANDRKPRIAQYVSRLLGAPYHCGYVSDVVSTQTGGNGTEVHTVEIETLYGVPQGRILVIVDSVGHIHETTQWQCSVCECFTTCVCERNLQSGD